MKLWITLLGLGLAGMAGAVELSQATNDQILDELGRRLQSGGPGPGPSGSSASYICDGSGYLYIYLTGPDGKTTNKYYHASDTARCSRQLDVLNRKKGRIHRVTIAAVCDGSGYLYRVTLLPDGKFGDAPYTHLGSYENCLTQATSLNGGN